METQKEIQSITALQKAKHKYYLKNKEDIIKKNALYKKNKYNSDEKYRLNCVKIQKKYYDNRLEKQTKNQINSISV